MKSLKLINLLMVFVLTGAVSCAQTESEADSSTNSVTESTQQDQPQKVAKDVDANTFEEMTADSSYVILDVRTPDEYKSGHIPGAVNMNFYENFGEQVKALDKDKTYLIYCRSGGRSSSAMSEMKDQGFTTLYNLQGGIMGWQKAGKDVE